MLRSTIGQNDLGESYFFLFGFGIMTNANCLKWDGQYPSSKHTLVIFRVLLMYLLYTRIFFKCLYEIWSRSGIELFLHFLRVSLNSCSMNLSQVWVEASWSSLRISWLTGQCIAKLYDSYNASYRFSIVLHSWLLYLIVSVGGSFLLQTQFMRSQGLLLVNTISYILSSKKVS